MSKLHLISVIWAVSSSIALAVRVSDQMHLSIPELVEKYNQTESELFSDPKNEKWLASDAGILINALGNKGGREFLPFFMEKSLSINLPYRVRENSISAYIKIADLNECLDFMHTVYTFNWEDNIWRRHITEQFLKKYTENEEELSLNKKAELFFLLIQQIQNPTNTRESNCIDQFLLTRVNGYSNSMQRAVIANTYANWGNEWMTNTFNPIKAHFDALPKSELVDLREQFPDLPPLPSEEEGGVRWVYGVGGIVLVVVGFRYFKCRVRGSK